jgi:WD40 repeat protein
MKIESALYNELSTEQLDVSSQLIKLNGYICLFGTNDAGLNRIYSKSLNDRLKSKLGLSGEVKIFDLSIFRSFTESLFIHNINLEDKNNDDLIVLNCLNFSEFISSLQVKDIDNELDEINKLISQGIYLIVNYQGTNKNISSTSLATFLNKAVHFIPDAGYLGLKYFIEEKSHEKSLVISPTCMDLMLEEIKDNYIPILLIIETLNQLNLSLKEYLQNESIVLPTHFEQVGGFKNVLQIKGFQLRKQYLHLLKTNHPQNTPLNEKQIKRLFQSFILIDDKGLAYFPNLSIDILAKKSNLKLSDIDIFLNEAKGLNFIKVNNYDYQLASISFLEHWEDMKNWVNEELEFVSIYKLINKHALSYFNGETGLLPDDLLKKALHWIVEATPTIDWALPYAKEFELTITYIHESEKQRLAQIEAKQRRSKRLLNTTRLISFIIGFAFLVSTLAALFAFLERNNAVKAKEFSELRRKEAIIAKEEAIISTKLANKERLNALKASKAEKLAKIQAENDKMIAINARDLANQEKLKAVEAKNSEMISKEMAEDERKLAILAKNQADKEKQNALKAREEADKSYVEASNNFKKAEKLRKQQEARADALKSFRLYLNNESLEGLKLARNAYTLNLENEGYIFETDIIKAMIFGLDKMNGTKNYIQLNQPLRNITISPTGKYVAIASINGLITIINSKTDEKINELKVPLNEFQSFCFTNTDQLLIGTSNGTLNIYETVNQLFKFKYTVKLTNFPIKSIHSISTNQNKFLISSGGNILMMNGILDNANIQTKIISTNIYLNKIDYIKTSSNILIPLDKSLLLLPLNNDKFDISFKTIKIFPNKLTSISSISFRGEEMAIVGDVKGYIYLVNLNNGEIIHDKKLHQSAISSCLSEVIGDHLMLISSGLDQEIQVDYLFFNIKNQIVTSSAANFDFHKGWVTEMSYHTQNKTVYSCSEDMTLRKWNFNPSDILKLIDEKIKNNN